MSDYGFAIRGTSFIVSLSPVITDFRGVSHLVTADITFIRSSLIAMTVCFYLAFITAIVLSCIIVITSFVAYSNAITVFWMTDVVNCVISS